MKIRVAAVLTIASMTALLTACGNGEEASEETIEVTTETTPSFEAQAADPTTVTNLNQRATDPGLNVEWEFQGTGYGNAGGSVIYVAVTNLNDVPVPPEEIGDPSLNVNGSSVELMDTDQSIPLDLPLGAGATTNLQFVFNTAYGNLWDAEFQVGNVIFDGNLNSY